MEEKNFAENSGGGTLISNNFDKIKDAWDGTYNKFGQNVSWATKERRAFVVNLVLDFAKKGNSSVNSLLDYGTGTGHVAVELKNLLSIPKVVGADISAKGVDKKHLEQNGVGFALINQPKDIGGKYDFILCWSVLFINDLKIQKKYLKQFADMLTDNGTLLIGNFVAEKNEKDAYNGLRYFTMSSPEFQKVLGKNKLRIVSEGEKVIAFDKKAQLTTGFSNKLFKYYFIQRI